MDLNHLLLWTVSLSCILILLSTRQTSPTATRGWAFTASAILAVTAVVFYANPAIAGLVGGSLWAIFILAPSLGVRRVNQLMAQQQFQAASQLAACLAWLHPADGWREQPQLLRALALAQQGAIAQATAILDRYRSANTPIRRQATITLYRIEARWSELLQWFEQEISPSILRKDPYLMIYYLRALGETGDLNRLLQTLEQAEPTLEKINDPTTRNSGRLFAFAFCGETERLTQLLNGPLAMYPPAIQQLWLATAHKAAGNEMFANEQLRHLSQSSDIAIRNAALQRLSQPSVNLQVTLSEPSKQILAQLETDLGHEVRYGRRPVFKFRKAKATYLLIGLNLAVFAVELYRGGSEDPYTLYQLGALVPEVVAAGEWWRLLSATFLHFGIMHLVMNMLALLFLGPFVELALSWQRYLLTYLVSGLGSMLTVTLLSLRGYSQADFVVGASGCIMGLIGATAAILLRGWQREKSKAASKGLRAIALIIGIQVIFDLTTPQISFIGHVSGLIIGFVVASFLKHDWQGQH